MNPSEVRQQILDQHADLRELIAALGVLAKRVAHGDASCAPALREAGRAVLAKLAVHLDFEDRHLIPAVRDADGWGDARADLIAREHAEQRATFDYVLERLGDDGAASMLLGRQVEALVDALLVDMKEEESTMLDADLLRDDVVGIDVEAG